MRRAAVATVVLAIMLGAAPSTALPKGLTAKAYASGFDFAIDMAWVPGTKKIFVTEKETGRIRVVNGGRVSSQPCADLDVMGDGERGLLGIVVHPNYKENHFLYVYYTNASPEQNRVTRFKVKNDRCTNPTHILKTTSTSGYHNGGQLEFMKGHLFVSTGELHEPSLAQDRNSVLGKVLRLNPDGSAPSGNPFGNKVWSYGHRNPFGLTHKPGSNKLYETENGPSCDDEFNRIIKGRNYGWGSGYDCGTSGVGSNPKGPLRRWSDVIVATDPLFYTGALGKLAGDVYVGSYGSGELHRLVMNKKGTEVLEDRVILTASSGIVSVDEGPGRGFYFVTGGTIYRVVRN